jgi:hypothetical protein
MIRMILGFALLVAGMLIFVHCLTNIVEIIREWLERKR